MYTTATDLQDKVAKGLSQLPPFSPVLNKLLASIASEDVRFSELSSLIEKDTVLSGNVLRLVNSAAYARRGEVNSIPHAISVLGLNKLRNMLLSLSISRMWTGVKTPREWSHARFNLHSVGTAILADQMAQNLPVSYPEGAFVAGLLHDFGKLLVASAMPTEFGEIQELYALGGRSLSECETEILGADHAAISAIALARWNLPQPIRTAVEYHHEPKSDPSLESQNDSDFRLSQLIQIADATVNRIGHSLSGKPAETDSETPEKALLQLAGSVGPQIYANFQTEFESIRQFF